MDVNVFSVIMTLVLFTVVSSICGWLLLTTKSSALWIVDFIFTLCIIRCLVPIEFSGTHNVNIWNIHPEGFLLPGSAARFRPAPSGDRRMVLAYRQFTLDSASVAFGG